MNEQGADTHFELPLCVLFVRMFVEKLIRKTQPYPTLSIENIVEKVQNIFNVRKQNIIIATGSIFNAMPLR